MDYITIVTSTSNKFAKHTGVMLHSLFQNSANNSLKIFILYRQLSSRNKMNLSNIPSKSSRASIDFVKVDTSKYTECRKGNRLKEEVYFRVSIPDLLDGKFKKAIYLDSDLIILEDIATLWDIDLSDHLVAAVEDPGAEKYGRFKALCIPKKYGYFNSGVMLLAVNKWRDLDISKKVLEYVQKHPEKCRLLDQDGLNAVLYADRKNLNLKWNYQTVHIGHYPVKPAIIHYTTKKKPWNSDHPLADYYHYYEKQIIWE